MEIFGCNDLVSYKVATRLKCHGFAMFSTSCNNLKVFNVFMQRLYGLYTPEVRDTHIWLLQFVNPIVNHFLEDPPHK